MPRLLAILVAGITALLLVEPLSPKFLEGAKTSDFYATSAQLLAVIFVLLAVELRRFVVPLSNLVESALVALIAVPLLGVFLAAFASTLEPLRTGDLGDGNPRQVYQALIVGVVVLIAMAVFEHIPVKWDDEHEDRNAPASRDERQTGR